MDTNTKINTEPLVSILMLTYNRANYIATAIESVLTQTYQNWELIVIDDGSTDDTKEVLAPYHDSRISYLRRNENKGLVYRRQESLTLVNGSYVAILDSDDIWLTRDKLKKQVEVLERDPSCSLVGTFINIIDERGSLIDQNKYYETDLEIRKNMLIRNQFANSSVMMRKSTLDKTAGYRNLSVAEDFELFLQLGQIGTFRNLPEYMTAYRVHTGNISSSKLNLIKYVLMVIKQYKDVYPGYYGAWLKFTLYRLFLTLRSLI